MKFSEVDYVNKEELRAKILEITGLDVETSQCHFSSRNFAFLFSEGCFPRIIRVGINPSRTTHNIMSELMWVDDLKVHVPNIAHMIPFADGSIEKEVKVGDDTVVVSQFRKVNGAVTQAEERDRDFIRMCGACLGQIHHTSKLEVQDGFRFKRFNWYENVSYRTDNLRYITDPRVIDEANRIINNIKAIPQTEAVYGMIHGDFQYKNIFRDWDNIWIFDFDDCCYGYYMIDIGTFISGLYSDNKYKPGRVGKVSVMEDLKFFREGYDKYMQLPEDMWDHFVDFLKLRTVAGLVYMDVLDFPEEFKLRTIAGLSQRLLTPDYLSIFDDKSSNNL